MTSRRVSQVVPGSTLTYAMSLRVRHPNLDPALLTETLHLEPLHSWRAGDPRLSPEGREILRRLVILRQVAIKSRSYPLVKFTTPHRP